MAGLGTMPGCGQQLNLVCVGALPLAGWMAALAGSPSLGVVSQMHAFADRARCVCACLQNVLCRMLILTDAGVWSPLAYLEFAIRQSPLPRGGTRPKM